MRGAFLAAMLAALAALPVCAQTADELVSLKAEQARLRQSLDELDRKIRVLEGASPDAPEKQSAPSLVALRGKWSEIRLGTPKARVDALLGAPERVMRINGDLVWYYVYPGVGRGSIFFSGDEKVTAAQPPAAGWSW